jgi:hypothetical protein
VTNKSDVPDEKPARDAHGRLLPGSTANPSGRPKLPDWFLSKGPASLRVLVAQATGEQIADDDGNVTDAVKQVATESTTRERGAAAMVVIDRIYGKVKDTVDVKGDVAVSLIRRIIVDKAKDDPGSP